MSWMNAVIVEATLTQIQFGTLSALVAFANERRGLARGTHETVVYVGFLQPIEHIVAVLLFEQLECAKLFAT